MKRQLNVNLEAEQSLLGAMLLSPAIVPSLADQVEARDFYREHHRKLFAAMVEMAEQGQSIDPITVGDKLRLEASAKAELITLAQHCPTVSNWPAYAEIVRREAINRELVALGEGLAAGEIEPDKSEEMLRGLRKRLEQQAPEKTVTSLAEVVAEVLGYTQEPMPAGLDYPWPRVNRLTRGMRPGWLIYLAGYTSHGKTAAAIEVAIATAKRGKRVLFISLEMSPLELGVRVAQTWGLDSWRLYAGKSNQSDLEAAQLAHEFPAHQNIQISYAKDVREIDQLTAELTPDLVIVDYLQLLSIGRETRIEGTTKNSHALKALAREREVPVLCLAQVRRTHPDAIMKPPTIHDLKDSGSIEQDADQVIMVFRERDEKSKVPKEAGCFLVQKSRMGMCGMEEFIFDGERQTFMGKETPSIVYSGGTA